MNVAPPAHASTPIDGPLHLVAVHVVARARQQATGRFSLRVTPGGLGTPEFGPDHRRVRISGGALIVESDALGAARVAARAIDGSSLRELAALAHVDLDAPLDVGHDTPSIGDPDDRLDVDAASAQVLARTYRFAAEVLDGTLTSLAAAGRDATLPRLWPEHMDVAIEAEARPDVRVNLGVSPGDGFHGGPYAYVGPWGDDRPGGPDAWNAPFGAYRPIDPTVPGEREASVRFLLGGVDRLH